MILSSTVRNWLLALCGWSSLKLFELLRMDIDVDNIWRFSFLQLCEIPSKQILPNNHSRLKRSKAKTSPSSHAIPPTPSQTPS